MNCYIRYAACLLFFSPVLLSAQRYAPAAAVASGGEGSADGIELSWTVGQAAAETRQSSRAILTEGVQQPLFLTSSLWESPVPLRLSIFPNPAHTSVLLTFEGLNEDVTLTLYNVIGQPVFQQPVRRGDTALRVPMTGLPDGVYLLSVCEQGGQQRAVYKIVKTK